MCKRGTCPLLDLPRYPGHKLIFRSSPMAQTSINIQPAKGGSERHNEREKEMEHIRKDLTHLNESWKSPDFPSMNEQLAAIRDDYKAAHGKALHAKATPLREAVVVIQENTTIEQLRAACDECNRLYGIQVMQIYKHLDEGYAHAKEWKPNRHAHIVFNWYNFDTHTTCKLNKYDMMEMQSIFARHLQMERGVSSDRRHLNAIQQKNAAEEKRLAELEAQVQEQANAHEDTVRKSYKAIRYIGLQTVHNFDWLQKPDFADAVPATQQEVDTRNRLDDAVHAHLKLRELKLEQLLEEQEELRVLIANLQKAINRIGKKLAKIAKSIPFWKKKRIAHEAELQADKASAERRAADAEARAAAAIEQASARETAAANAERTANERKAQADAERSALQAQRNSLSADIQKAKQTALDTGWNQGYTDGKRKATDELQPQVTEACRQRDEYKQQLDKAKADKQQLQQTKDEWLDDFRSIADTLTKYKPEVVTRFEEIGIRERVGENIWDAAKERNHPKRTTGYTRKGP